jgi:hypothetical protein
MKADFLVEVLKKKKSSFRAMNALLGAFIALFVGVEFPLGCGPKVLAAGEILLHERHIVG